MSLSAGTRLGPYEIVSAIGAGGMGEVFKARDTRLNRDVAIKVLPDSVARDPERLGRFEREAQAVAALSHPNILSIFDFGTADEVTYAVMELLQGETLRELVGQRPLAPRRAVEIGTQVAHGLAAAHDKGIVHRDLKPENVFVTTDGQVKILDFGLARSMAAPAVVPDGPTILGRDAGTTPGMVVGTMGYMAPEQVRGETVDARTDIFAFGALVYELLTGERAFKGATPADTMSAILKEDPADARTRDGALPPTLDHLIRRCLEKAPARRFQSAHDLAFALEHALGSSASFAAPPVAPAPRAARRLFLPVALVALGMLAVGVGVGYVWRPSAPARIQPAFEALTLDSGVESWPSLSPDGTSFIFVSDAAGNDDIYLRRLNGRNAINLTADSPANDTTPAFSPDGRFIAFRSERNGGGIFVMEATGENVKRVSDAGQNPAWSPDGKSLAFATERTINPAARNSSSRIWVVDVATGTKRKVGDFDAMQPSWSPDGRRLACWSVDGGQRILKTIAIDGGEATPVFAGDPSTLYWNPVWTRDNWFYFVSNESGAMAIGRVPVDASGRATGARETIMAPAGWVGQLALSTDGQRIAYQAVAQRNTLWRAAFDPVAGTAGPPTTILAGALTVTGVAASPDGQTLAFSNTGGAAREDIFTIDRDGHHLRQLTDDAARDRGPTWTPDGKRIVFYSNRRGHYEAWAMGADGSDLHVVATAPDNDDWMWPRFSADGRLSVVGLKAPAILDATSTPAKLLSTLAPIDSSGDTQWPIAWSADGSTLAGGALSKAIGRLLPDVVLYHPASCQFERLTGMGFPIAWLPDGKRLLVSDDRLYVLDLATKRRTVAASWPADPMLVGLTTTLADHGRTVFHASTTTDADIWMMTLGGKK